jgi:hypothetical protein
LTQFENQRQLSAAMAYLPSFHRPIDGPRADKELITRAVLLVTNLDAAADMVRP